MVKNFFLIIVLILTFVSIAPLLKSGLPPTHDGEYHVVRFYEFYKTFIDGNLYPRWAPDLNYSFGLPILSFVYPLPNYVASFLHIAGVSFIDSFKLNMIFASFFGAIFFYLWSKDFFGRLGALVSSIFYTFSPYHFLDIYIRGSVGEVWALGLFPAFLWSITKFIKERKLKFAILSSIFLTLIIFSHNILALMFFPFALSYILFLVLQLKDIKRLLVNNLYIILLSLGLSSIFWLPALFERQYVLGLEVFDYSFHFSEIYELIIPSWGSGFSGGQLSNQLSFQIGIANLFAVLLSFIVILIKRKEGDLKVLLFFLGWFILAFFLMTKASLPVWQNVPFMNYFQFPWRFLSLEILFASFLAGSIVYLWKSNTLAVLMIALSFLLGIGYTNLAYYHQRTDEYYIQRSNFIDGTNSPGNAFNTIWFKNVSERKEDKLTLSDNNVQDKSIKSTSYSFLIDVSKNKKITVNTAFFPGWTVYVDRKKKDIEITDKGLFFFEINKGKHEIFVNFEDTFIRKLATLLFLFSLMIILFKMPFFATIKK